MPLAVRSEATRIRVFPAAKARMVFLRSDVRVVEVSVPIRGSSCGARIAISRESRKAFSFDLAKMRTVVGKRLAVGLDDLCSKSFSGPLESSPSEDVASLPFLSDAECGCFCPSSCASLSGGIM